MTSLFKHLLIPVDFAEKNTAALEVAAELAAALGAKVTLLHVIATLEDQADEVKDFYQELEQNARDKLAGMSGRFSDVEVQLEVIFGHGAPEIIDYADREAVDLLVLSSHKVNVEERPSGWGTLSYKISFLCQCPVLLVK